MDTKVFSTLDKQQLCDLFYSDLFKELRGKYYKTAYEQGRFDEYTETTYGVYPAMPPMKQVEGTTTATVSFDGEMSVKEREYCD